MECQELTEHRDIPTDLARYPGGDLIAAGLQDIARETYTEEALLVLISGPRLRRLGFDVPGVVGIAKPYEHALYDAIERRRPNGAHSAYNALIRKVVSFARTYKRPG
jgi:hypothetical protein